MSSLFFFFVAFIVLTFTRLACTQTDCSNKTYPVAVSQSAFGGRVVLFIQPGSQYNNIRIVNGSDFSIHSFASSPTLLNQVKTPQSAISKDTTTLYLGGARRSGNSSASSLNLSVFVVIVTLSLFNLKIHTMKSFLFIALLAVLVFLGGAHGQTCSNDQAEVVITVPPYMTIRFTCPGQPTPCSGHGYCNNPDSKCLCDQGWTGTDCSIAASICPSCSGHGTCSASTNYRCACDQGWAGPTCATSTIVCSANASAPAVSSPVFWKQYFRWENSWFASAIVYDLDNDGVNEVVASFYHTFILDNNLNLIFKETDTSSRVYAPPVVWDLDNDGVTEVCVGNGKYVYCWEYKSKQLVLKSGWPRDTTTAGQSPEVRGMAAADLDGDGNYEVVVSTTQTALTKNGAAQIFAYSPNGANFQPAGGHNPAWPRYNNLKGPGNDLDANGMGEDGYGCYGLNIGIGNFDDTPELEVFATYDNHFIQAFAYDGVAQNTSTYFTNPQTSKWPGRRLTWGQMIRWVDPTLEDNHYHTHTGNYPDPSWTEWTQWSYSPVSIADLDQDGKFEVIGVPQVELNDPYELQGFIVWVFQGNYGDNGGLRQPGWEYPPVGQPVIQPPSYYPPVGIPAPVPVNIMGDSKLELLVSLMDHHMYCFDYAGHVLWRFDYSNGFDVIYATEPTVGDLNGDGSVEIVFGTFGLPDQQPGHIIVLSANGDLLYDIPSPTPGDNGNGNGYDGSPSLYDIDGDGSLEILAQSFDRQLDVFKVPGKSGCVPWATSRGGRLRKGQPDVMP